MTKIPEEVAVNNVGGGNIAGVGIGPKGEPPMRPKAISKYKKNNMKDAASKMLAFSAFIKRAAGGK